MYQHGIGVRQDSIEAVSWYRKAAEQGDVRGQFGLGMRYYNGEGVTQDLVKAASWFRKAAEQGNPQAQLMLDSILEGRGVP